MNIVRVAALGSEPTEMETLCASMGDSEMKILVFGEIGYPDSFSKNIFVTLKSMGHEVRAVVPFLFNLKKPSIRGFASYTLHFFPSLERRNYGRLLMEVSKFLPDLILVAGGEGPPPSVVRDLKRRTEAKIVLWFPDALVNFNRQYILAADYDAYFFKD